MTVITDPLFYALAVPAVVALGLSKGGFSGVGQMATPMLALVMPPLEAAAILLPIMIVQDGIALWVYRKDWNGRILAVLIPGAIVGIGLAWLARSLYFRRRGARVHRRHHDRLRAPHLDRAGTGRAQGRQCDAGAGVFLGALSGFTSTLCQAGGPPYQMYVLSQNLPKMTFVGTSAIFFATMNSFKVVPYFALGQFSTKGFATSLVLLPLAIVTNQLGFWVVRVTPHGAVSTSITLMC